MIYEFAQSTFLHAPDLMMVKDTVAVAPEGRQNNGSFGVTICQRELGSHRFRRIKTAVTLSEAKDLCIRSINYKGRSLRIVELHRQNGKPISVAVQTSALA
jgi:hypothetical protein